MVLGTVSIVESVFYSLLHFIPFYRLAKGSFLFYCFLPSTNGAQKVLDQVLGPLLTPYESTLDIQMSRITSIDTSNLPQFPNLQNMSMSNLRTQLPNLPNLPNFGEIPRMSEISRQDFIDYYRHLYGIDVIEQHAQQRASSHATRAGARTRQRTTATIHQSPIGTTQSQSLLNVNQTSAHGQHSPLSEQIIPPNISNIPNMQNMQNMHDLSGLQNLHKLQKIQNFQNIQNIQNIQSHMNQANVEAIQTQRKMQQQIEKQKQNNIKLNSPPNKPNNGSDNNINNINQLINNTIRSKSASSLRRRSVGNSNGMTQNHNNNNNNNNHNNVVIVNKNNNKYKRNDKSLLCKDNENKTQNQENDFKKEQTPDLPNNSVGKSV